MVKPKKSKRYNYNLESVLKVRNIREKLQIEETARAKRKLQEEQEKQDKIKLAQDLEHQNILNLYSGEALDFTQIQLRKHHLTKLTEDFQKQEIETNKAVQKKEKEEKNLIKAVKDRKILDKDKDKKRALWKKLMEKEDVKFLDDISVSRFFRNNEGVD